MIPNILMSVVVCGVLVTVSAETVSAQGPPTDKLDIRVRIANVARLSDQTLVEMEEQTGWIFGRAGIGITWEADSLGGLAVSGQGLADPTEFELRTILPGKVPPRSSLSEATLGYATHRSDGGTLIFVLLGRVNDLASNRVASVAQILAFVVAHELGHLLIGNPGHSPRGLMSATFGVNELQEIAMKRLLFDHEEIKALRGGVMVRKARIMTSLVASRNSSR